jgi:hypothetical protein
MKFAGKNPMPTSALFIDGAIYAWKIYDLHSISCWWSGRRQESEETFKKLWKLVEKGGIVPEWEIERLTNNKKFFAK